ncbi:MAG TPA: DUF433 domain-containing protein [Anaerolineae bacterium]|jgi:uncharacterized protein (DUF433 family)|nr:DUF433 domain-containing protein [Ardenticatenia bacterium]HQZ70007.1 DUF433 domain-containing protein [Anaerolineae bacterium]HRA20346.1 DUF433 domain-containing protein [Anaerolineae bacterium]
MTYSRITVDPAQMGGVPCLRGLRIPVATVVAMVANGLTRSAILDAYPALVPEDMGEALRFAAEALLEHELPMVAIA